MPILIKDYSWRQTEDLIIVRVPLHNIPPSKIDLFTSEIYIKVHYPPFLFESCLYDKINEEESECTFVEGEAVFRLSKLERKNWPTLHKELSKQQMMAVKKEAIDLSHEKATENSKRMKERRGKRQRACCSEQVALEGEVHKKVEELKMKTKGTALAEIQDWKEKETDKDFLPGPLRKASSKLQALKEKIREENVKQTDKSNENCSMGNPADNRDIFTEREVSRDTRGKEKKELEVEKTPALRNSGTIGVNFTFRAFPTPSRESKLNEENEWLRKTAEARRKTGFVAEDLKPEENDPDWLLQKGNSFHKVGNYLGAISAFSHALLTWKKIPELWIARSESQLALGNYRRVLRDTTEALDLLKPHVAVNAELRFTSHLNRGRALLEIGQAKGALADLEEALEIHPFREDIHALIGRAEEEMERAKYRQQPTQQEAQNKFIEPEDLAN